MKDERVVSNDSSSEVDNYSDTLLSSVDPPYSPVIDSDDVYMYTLKLVLLEYINEPRFRAKFIKKDTATNEGTILRSQSHNQQTENRKSLSWFYSSNDDIFSNESVILQTIIPKLKDNLSYIAINKVKIENTVLRRSLLKFYNDVFLEPQMSTTVNSMLRFEELIMLFTRSANGEITKLEISDHQEELYNQISYFIDILIKISCTSQTSHLNLVEKLKNYKLSFMPKSQDKIIVSPIMSKEAHSDMINVTLKPTFKLQEITHSTYLMELFGIEKDKLQQDITKLIPIVKNNKFQQELRKIKTSIVCNQHTYQESDFTTSEKFKQWKDNETKEIDALIYKFEQSKTEFNEACHSNFNDRIIPLNARDILVSLMCLILNHEKSKNNLENILSTNAFFIFSKCAKYWRLEIPIVRANLLYTSANLTILKDKELCLSTFEAIFQIIHLRILQSNNDVNIVEWPEPERKQWFINLNYSFEQFMGLFKSLLKCIYDDLKPKFSKILEAYYSYIQNDPLLMQYNFLETVIYKKWIKKLRKELFRTSEKYYISLVCDVPTDKTISIRHIYHIGETILIQIKSIQKKYPKLLLEKISISFECAAMLIKAFSTDIPTMLKLVEGHSEDQNSTVSVNDAIKTYKNLQELRAIYLQVQQGKFSINLEKFFVKYLSQFCDEASDKIQTTIINSIQNEKWERIDATVYYSHSAIDIFKMIHEIFLTFKNIEWGNNYQISKIYTFLLKSFTDGLKWYALKIMEIIEDELMQSDKKEECDENIISQSASEKVKNTWIFNEMKNALKISSSNIPETYEFTRKTCVCLNTLSEMILKIDEFEDNINPTDISYIVNKYEKVNTKKNNAFNIQDKSLHQLYTIKILRAENIKGYTNNGLSNAAVTLIDSYKREEVAKTKVVRSSINPFWDEEFEIEVSSDDVTALGLIVWHYSSKSNSLKTAKICGKCSLSLDSRKFREDGLPKEIIIDLDTQGKMYLQVSLETEKLDASFCISRARRAFLRASDRTIGLVVSKFSSFVNFAFSRSTLRTVCGNHGHNKANKNEIYDAVVPLFDYLNANLNILASELSEELLYKVILQAWSVILNAADCLLLPFLSCAKLNENVNSKSKTIWENAVTIAMGNFNNIIGFGRSLTQNEVEVVFDWLRALCIDFFHNDGEGPSLEDLKNHHYQTLLLIPVFYDKSIKELKNEVESIFPQYMECLRNRTLHAFEHNVNSASISQVIDSIQYTKTTRRNSKDQNRKIEQDQLDIFLSTQDIILRILVVKGEWKYVSQTLERRDKMSRQIATKGMIKAAIRGKNRDIYHV